MARRERRAAGELEGDVLAVLWSEGRALTPGEVHTALGSDLAYTTVATILGRLHDKGIVERDKTGRTHTYRATADEAEVVRAGFQSVLTRSHDRRALLQGFVESLSEDDEATIRELLERARETRRGAG
jgi:predicted transcriptional regulator